MTGERRGDGWNGANGPVDPEGMRFDERGLVPVVAQDVESGDVLMLAYANREALRLTLETGQAHYFSRSRDELWRKGATSGNGQQVERVAVDCDEDTLLYLVRQTGPACHTGNRSCFFRSLPHSADADSAARADPAGPASHADPAIPATRNDSAAPPEQGESLRLGEGLALLESVVAQRLAELPEGSYVAGLHQRGLGYMAQKVVEEAGETVVAALERRDEELLGEAADLLFHLTVLLRESGHGLVAVAEVLRQRHEGSGNS